jgi:hypothetical protein
MASGKIQETFPGREKRPERFRRLFPAGKSVQRDLGDFSRPGKEFREIQETFPGREKRSERFRRLFPAGKNV